jgi:hypothetical protein
MRSLRGSPTQLNLFYLQPDMQVSDSLTLHDTRSRLSIRISTALLEDPTFFNFAVGYFLDMKYDGLLPYY